MPVMTYTKLLQIYSIKSIFDVDVLYGNWLADPKSFNYFSTWSLSRWYIPNCVQIGQTKEVQKIQNGGNGVIGCIGIIMSHGIRLNNFVSRTYASKVISDLSVALEALDPYWWAKSLQFRFHVHFTALTGWELEAHSLTLCWRSCRRNIWDEVNAEIRHPEDLLINTTVLTDLKTLNGLWRIQVRVKTNPKSYNFPFPLKNSILISPFKFVI